MEQDDPVAARTGRLIDGLRVFGGSYGEITRRFAAHLGLHATDATALIEILQAEDQGTPLTPARLAERVGLSSGAATNLVNRLERAGHVVRSREHGDRRVVTLRTSPEIVAPAMRFFEPFDARMRDLVSRHSAEALDAVEAVLADLRDTMDAALGEAPDRPRSRPRTGGQVPS